MKNCRLLLSFLIAALMFLAVSLQAEGAKIKVLIIDGQNNHQWAKTTPLLKAILDEAGIFTVDVTTTPPAAPKAPALPKNATPEQKAAHAVAMKIFDAAQAAQKETSATRWAAWRPHFSDYDVLVSNYNGEDWPTEVRSALIAFVKNGGGFVSYHAADNSFADWPDYNEMIALGGWGGRTESGPYLRLRDGAWKKTPEPGLCGNHGARAEFLVENFAPEHPIMQGLPAKWMHTQDELYNRLRGPADNVSVLASGLSDVTHEQEPLLMAINYGKGRVFHTTLGHYIEALNGVGFQITFARGVEWAATGKVTLPAPKPGVLTDHGPAAVHELKVTAAKPTSTSSAMAAATSNDGFVSLFNGKDLDNWDLKLRCGDAELAKKVYTVDNGMVHVFKDFPAEYELNTGSNRTHGLFYTQKSYSKFIFRFEYKWGKTIANNFKQFQYDAGMYYHVSDSKIWPVGIEYQVRYDHIKNKNHTGDFWGRGFQWTADDNGCFLLPKDGGKLQPPKGGEHAARADAEFHALDDQWNQCEVIVMGNQYAIHKLNGKIVNVATQLSQGEGIIGLQSETAEIYYRNIQIKEFNEIVPMETFIQ